MENKFKCKDEVIYRTHKKTEWMYGIYSYQGTFNHFLVGDILVKFGIGDVLPYEGNEHLVGTTDEPEKPLLFEGQIVLAFCDFDELLNHDLVMGKFKGVDEKIDMILIEGSKGTHFRYCVPFSKFDSFDYGATKAEVIMVSEDTHKLVKFEQKKDNKGTIVTGY